MNKTISTTTTQTQPMPTDDDVGVIRRVLAGIINANPGTRETLAAAFGQVWSSQELTKDFEVLGFMAPFVVVRRRSDGQKGTLEFQHQPRFYYQFLPDRD